MKFFNYTYRNISIFLFVLMSAWGVFFYYTILDEITDETDDTLKNYRSIIVKAALKDPGVLDTSGKLMSRYFFRSISEEEAANYEEKFYDSTVYIEIEGEDEPVRVMKSCFMMPDGQFHELEVMISTLEREDMVQTIFWYLLVLYLLLIISLIVVTRMVLKRSFHPLERLLNWLERVQPGKEVPPFDNETKIQELRRLGEAAVAMSNRSYNVYREQKQFIENASHELQTPLAIAYGKVELLAESDNLTGEQMKELDGIHSTLGRAIRLNKSLLLLTRIENKQYADAEDVELNKITDTILPDLMDIYGWKQVKLMRADEGKFIVHSNVSLAQILVSNLLKNALVHNPEHGELHIFITARSFFVKNSGSEPLDGEKIFRRFYHDREKKKDSTGLGLAIARSIATSCGLTLEYVWDGMHGFRLS